MSTQRRFWVLPPRLHALLFGAAAAVHWGLGWRPPVARAPLLGALSIAGGLLLNAWATRSFEAADTPVRPDSEPRAFVVTGPFRWSRNPMYFGLILSAVGVALVVGSAPFWAVPLVSALALRLAFIRHEERVLRRRFGAAYESYLRQVGRWFGRKT